MAFGTVKVDSITSSTQTLNVDDLATDASATTAVLGQTTANFTGTLQNGGSNVVVDTDIGSTVQGFDADTAKTDTAQTFTKAQRGTITTLTDGATITPDFSASNNFEVTIAATGRTLANPTNITAGQSGVIVIKQDGSGSRTITSYGSYFKFPGGTDPTLSTGANDVDLLSYYCVSSTFIAASLGADFS